MDSPLDVTGVALFARVQPTKPNLFGNSGVKRLVACDELGVVGGTAPLSDSTLLDW